MGNVIFLDFQKELRSKYSDHSPPQILPPKKTLQLSNLVSQKEQGNQVPFRNSLIQKNLFHPEHYQMRT